MFRLPVTVEPDITRDMNPSSLPAGYLGRKSPFNAWEAFFLIGIFPEASPLRWVKFQLFSGGRNPGKHCMSALEAMDGPGEELILIGWKDRIETVKRPLGSPYLSRSSEAWEVQSSKDLKWTGDWPNLSLHFSLMGVKANTAARNVLVWADIPRVLTYWSAFGELDWQAGEASRLGVGIVEHAWGGDTRIDVARLAPPRWHWDVLTFDDGAACAGLSATVAGRQIGLRSGGTAPGQPFTTGRGIQVKVNRWADEEGRHVPLEWSGELKLGDRIFSYAARKSTPLAPAVPHGGFMGFDFEGRWNGDGGNRTHRGTGFTEYRAVSTRL